MCVTDLDRTERFYCEGLGFTPSGAGQCGPEWSPHTGVPGTELLVRFVERDGVRIELLQFTSGMIGETTMRPLNQLGLTHMMFRVDDIETVAAKLAELGGTMQPTTRVQFPNGDGGQMTAMYMADPDGVRVDLMQHS
jgi:catechol 2,3-dioxygenase-like lactoylglutathione lyase family enzyme